MKNLIVRYRQALIALLMILLNGAGAFASAPWTVNPADFRYDMSLYLDVAFKSGAMDYDEYEVAAFYGDECRGIAEVLPLPDGRKVLYLRARSNAESGEMMTFRYYSRTTGEVLPIEGVDFEFKSNERLGFPSDPYKVTIVFYYDVTLTAGAGGSVSSDGGRLAQDTELTLTATPDEGYHFVKWSDESTENPRSLTVNSDIELEASFEVNTYMLTYMVDDVLYKEFEVKFGETVTAEAEPEKEGHTFSGWQGLPETMPASDVTVTGVFTINSYNAIFKIGEDVIETISVVYGQPVTAPEAPAKEGHTFAGWQNVPEEMPAHDVVILGSYTVNKYKLIYMVDDAIYKEFEVEYGAAVTAEAEPEKEGHTFSGWQGLPETMPASDVTVTGVFTINSYKAVFKIGEDVIETRTVVYGQPVGAAPEAPAKEGHTFAGWGAIPETMPAHDVEILGSYTVNKYKLTYMVDDTLYKEVEVEYGAAVTAEAEPEKEGHTFSGWQGLPETMPASDVTVTGVFTINSYKAVFKIGEDVIETRTVVYGQFVGAAPEAPAKEGHTFAGWGAIPETMPAHDVEILGSYTVNKYKLNIYLDNKLYSSESVEYGAKLNIVTPDVPEGREFERWVDEIPETMPAHDLDIHGVTKKVSSVMAIEIAADQKVTVTTITGMTLYRDAEWGEVRERLRAGLYIINGTKYMVGN